MDGAFVFGWWHVANRAAQQDSMDPSAPEFNYERVMPDTRRTRHRTN